MTPAKDMTLRELAERCEAATGPDRSLNRDIADAIGLGPDETWERKRSTEGLAYFDEDCWTKGNALRRAPAYTASLDAALTLVPEGWARHYSEFSCPQWMLSHPSQCVKGKAATPALALTTAALRARASQESNNGQ